MKNYILIILFLLIIIFLVSFRNRNKREIKCFFNDPVSIKKSLKPNSLFVLDTTIILKRQFVLDNKGTNLSDSLAKKILYNHFKKQGYLIPEELKGSESDSELCVRYNKIFKFRVKENQFISAIISYWIAPPYANGHCLQPSKAIIVHADKRFEITNEEFMPTNFAIDSVALVEDKPTIYGYDYDCVEHKVLRHLKITLK